MPTTAHVYLDIETLDWFGDEHIRTLPRPVQLLAMRFGLATVYNDQTRQWLQVWPPAPLSLNTPLDQEHDEDDWSHIWHSVDLNTHHRQPGFDLVDLWRTFINQTIVGWNVFDFDLPLLMLHLKAYYQYAGDPWVDPMRVIDLMAVVKQASRAFGRERWYKLQDVSMATLGRGKSGDGQQAAQWLRAGEGPSMQAAANYCRDDVQLTVDLFAAAQAGGLRLPARPERGEVGGLRLWVNAEGQIKDCRREEETCRLIP